MKDRGEILAQLTTILEEMFEVEPATVTLEAQLYDELDIDSIDAVDLVARLRTISGKRIDPEDFKSVRTVGDVVEAIYDLMNPRET